MSSFLEIRERFKKIRSFKKEGQRAPHKSILLLIALSALQLKKRWISFSEVEEKFIQILNEFGPDHQSPRPEYPFWRLQNDGIWIVPENDIFIENSSGDVSITKLRQIDPIAGFTDNIYNLLEGQHELINELAATILDNTFPQSLHFEVLDAIEFPWSITLKRRRDPNFRELLLNVYERRCAICGYDGYMGSKVLGLEAAHIKWHAAGGPDSVENGLLLCSLHHVAYDRGAIAIDKNYRIIVSEKVKGANQIDTLFIKYSDVKIRLPVSGALLPGIDYLSWHLEQVFRKPVKSA